MYAQDARVEELESDESDDDINGRRVFSDELRFVGGNMAPRRRDPYAHQEYYQGESTSEESDSEVSHVSQKQVALRDKEEALVESALARIKRAQDKGKVEVKLREDELKALEDRRKRLQAEATAKAKKSKSGKKKSSPPTVTVPVTHPDLQYIASNSQPSSRRPSRQHLNDAVATGPGVLVEGPDGRVTYQPISYPSSPSGPRSSSAMSSQAYRQPQQAYPYGYPMPGRHVSDNTRPPSSASQSSRPLPHEEEWQDSRRSSLNSQVSYNPAPLEYQIRDGPIQGEDRRYYSQPHLTGVQYSNIPRAPPYFHHANSDPTIMQGSSRRHEVDLAGSDSEDELNDPKQANGGVKIPQPEPKKGAVKRKPVGKKKGKR